MRSFVAHLIVALALAVAGVIGWGLGNAERRVAAAHEQLVTMQYGAVADSAGLEQSLQFVAPVPRVGDGMTSVVHQDKATAEYWLARYDAISTTRDAAGTVVERDPQVLFLAANAAYRTLDLSNPDKTAVVRSLDGIIKSYAEVLKSSGSHEDAAYNYELLTRLRESTAKARPATGPVKADLTGTTGLHPTIHGRQGAPPKGVDLSRFKIMIPKRSDERQENIEPGKGDAKTRKG